MLCVGCDGELVTPFLNLTEVLSECWEERGAVGQFCKHEGAFKARYEDLAASKPVSPEGSGLLLLLGFPGGSGVKTLPANAGDGGFNSWVGKIPW